MGLDMYLNAKLNLSGYRFSTEEEKNTFSAVMDAAGLAAAADPGTPSAEVSVTVAYWRKANAIHRWFVENVQNGTDDCGEYHVTREQLGELRAMCEQVIDVAKVEGGQPVVNGWTVKAGEEMTPNIEEGEAVMNSDEVEALLPTAGGFFFGSTAYDSYYMDDIRDTITQIDRVMATLPERAHLYYQSSW